MISMTTFKPSLTIIFVTFVFVPEAVSMKSLEINVTSVNLDKETGLEGPQTKHAPIQGLTLDSKVHELVSRLEPLAPNDEHPLWRAIVSDAIGTPGGQKHHMITDPKYANDLVKTFFNGKNGAYVLIERYAEGLKILGKYRNSTNPGTVYGV